MGAHEKGVDLHEQRKKCYRKHYNHNGTCRTIGL